ncbi:hypothetical protein yrohd0001_640 [Yersinia rohdei ATCC 43380]|nr:hypothetical protein yrohd0001_640 [Yersinia rohdei ATCC 43380]
MIVSKYRQRYSYHNYCYFSHFVRSRYIAIFSNVQGYHWPET